MTKPKADAGRIAKHLRRACEYESMTHFTSNASNGLVLDAADCITELAATLSQAEQRLAAMEFECGRLKEALEPFAAYADRLDADAGGPFPNTAPLGYAPNLRVGSRPNIGDVRRAREARTSALSAPPPRERGPSDAQRAAQCTDDCLTCGGKGYI